jgi:hypothetical protein
MMLELLKKRLVISHTFARNYFSAGHHRGASATDFVHCLVWHGIYDSAIRAGASKGKAEACWLSDGNASADWPIPLQLVQRSENHDQLH